MTILRAVAVWFGVVMFLVFATARGSGDMVPWKIFGYELLLKCIFWGQ